MLHNQTSESTLSAQSLLKEDIENSEAKLKSVVFFVKATTYEKLALKQEFKDKAHWEQDPFGFWQQIGCIGKDKSKPVCVSFMFARIYGQLVCFYETTSRYNDTQLVDKWLQKNYPVKWDKGTRTAIANALNFHHAIDCCKNFQPNKN